MFDERAKPPSASKNSLASELRHTGSRPRAKFDGHCLKKDGAVI